MNTRFFKYVVSVLLITVLALPALAFLPSVGAQQDPQVLIWIFWDGAPPYGPSDGRPVWFVTGWAVCRAPGLQNAYQNAFAVELKVDGQVLLDGSVKTTKPYWLPVELWETDAPVCNNHADKVYGAWWLYDLSWLEVGTHTLEWTVTQTHQLTDLYDVEYLLPDGTLIPPDGKPDKYPASVFSTSATVIVTAAP